MGEYFSTGKQVLYRDYDGAGIEHIADAGDNEKAHAIAARMNGVIDTERAVSSPDFDYVAQAMQTMSPSFYGDKVAKATFVRVLNTAIEALTALDRVKKSLFYGRDNNLISDGQRNCSDIPAIIYDGSLVENSQRLDKLQAIMFVHGAIGYATEAGEMLEALRNAINGKGVDAVNIKEESGDGKWYLAILAYTFGYAWTDDERTNIAKLRLRFPDKFTDYDANNRNLVGERKVLETHLPIGERATRMPGERHLDGDAIEAATRAGPVGDCEGMDC